jgi:hypothetical protein
MTPGVVLTFEEMVSVALPGYWLALWDKDPVAYVIEDITNGPSHVIRLAKFPQDVQIYEFEAVFPEGCRLLPLSHYQKNKNRMALCRRKGATDADVEKAIGTALSCLGRRYEVPEEIEIALHKILPFVRVQTTENDLFCSGALELDWSGTSVPFIPSGTGGNLTPMQCLVDPGTEIVAWVN